MCIYVDMSTLQSGMGLGLWIQARETAAGQAASATDEIMALEGPPGKNLRAYGLLFRNSISITGIRKPCCLVFAPLLMNLI